MKKGSKTRKASENTGFCIEIYISKASLSQPFGIMTTTGVLRGFLRAARRETLNGTRRPTLRSGTNIDNISKSIAIFEEKLANWDSDPITSEAYLMLFICGNLPHETSRNNTNYVIDYVDGYYRIRISGDHNAVCSTLLSKKEKYMIGITFKPSYLPSTFVSQPKVYYKEHVYYTDMLVNETLKSILQGVVNVLKGGLYDVECDKEEYSPSKTEYLEKYNNGIGGLGDLVPIENIITDPEHPLHVGDRVILGLNKTIFHSGMPLYFEITEAYTEQYTKPHSRTILYAHHWNADAVYDDGKRRNLKNDIKAVMDIRKFINRDISRSSGWGLLVHKDEEDDDIRIKGDLLLLSRKLFK